MNFNTLLQRSECDCNQSLYDSCDCHNLPMPEQHTILYVKKLRAIVSTGLAMRSAQKKYFELAHKHSDARSKALRTSIALEKKYDGLVSDLIQWQKNIKKHYSPLPELNRVV